MCSPWSTLRVGGRPSRLMLLDSNGAQPWPGPAIVKAPVVCLTSLKAIPCVRATPSHLRLPACMRAGNKWRHAGVAALPHTLSHAPTPQPVSPGPQHHLLARLLVRRQEVDAHGCGGPAPHAARPPGKGGAKGSGCWGSAAGWRGKCECAHMCRTSPRRAPPACTAPACCRWLAREVCRGPATGVGYQDGAAARIPLSAPVAAPTRPHWRVFCNGAWFWAGLFCAWLWGGGAHSRKSPLPHMM